MPEQDVDVSVIVAVHNGAATLAQCIDSVLGQTGCDVELIIVDALSDDGTKEIVESYGDAIATYIREADTGIYDAWNKALTVTQGEWCSFLGADDYYLEPTSVATLLETAHKSSPDAVFIYGGVLKIGGAESYVFHPDPSDALSYLRSGRMLPHPGALHNVKVLRGRGGFDESFRIAGDYAAVLGLLNNGEARRSSVVTTAMRIGGISDSPATRRLLNQEWFRVVRENRGSLMSVVLLLRRRVEPLFGQALEGSFALVLGRRVGFRAFLRLRRMLGLPPRSTPPRWGSPKRQPSAGRTDGTSDPA